jgi:hypothetical protein
VEYQFPVVATSRDKHEPNAMATEVMRVMSTKVVGNCKSGKFYQVSSFII